jgi:3-oxoacyl-[acyl-carrier protein] reductase
VCELLDALPPDPEPPRIFPRVEPTMSRELAGLRALVTGSTSGIGKAIALELARGGADVIVHGRRSKDSNDSIVEQLFALGREPLLMLADLSDPAACDRLANDAWDVTEGLDIFVANAGADLVTGTAAEWPFERKLDELLAVDVRATVQLCRAIGERMKAGRGGVILTIGWDQAETGFEGESGLLFSTAKGGIMAFTRSLARNLAPLVRVNCLAPGWIKTEWGEGASARWQERVANETPLRRWGLPEDVAAAARWLASPAAAFITGQMIRINGGAV